MTCKRGFRAAGLSLVLAWWCIGCAAANETAPTSQPPKVPREFRGVWVATVGNSDWPSKPGLSTAEQKAELIVILDRAARLNLNTVIFQVRPACDALYASQIEPWSEYLTGTMGRAPSPAYDPLAFAVEEAHRRGLELHAWFNPYRALHFNAKSAVSANHISKTRPHLVRSYGRYLWLDPGEREVQDYSSNVILDVVKRYDIDGVHIDDYFYPYPEKGNDGRELDFPDDASWKKSGATSGLSRDDWRRENVNVFIQRLNREIKARKPWVKFGISPFGIWRPGHPAQIKGFDQHEQLYADARKWIVNGWADYFVPQLYWGIEPAEQSFPVLLDWWADQNVRKRTLCAGVDVTKSGKWSSDEIPNQINITRRQQNSHGYVLWNMKATGRNAALCERLRSQLNHVTALAPAVITGDGVPPQPVVRIDGNGSGGSARITWSAPGSATNRFWAVQIDSGGDWNTEIFPASRTSMTVDRANVRAVAVSLVDRAGVIGPAGIVELTSSSKPLKFSSPRQR